MKILNKKSLFVFCGFLIIAIILYLGVRAIEHEVLSRQYQRTQLAESRVDTITLIIKRLLDQKVTYIEAIANFIEPTESNLNHLLDNEIEIKNIFVINHNQIVFPSNKDNNTSWRQIAESIANDPSMLATHYFNSEQAKPFNGWYFTYDNNGPVLIYWQQRQQQILGFQLSYVKLLLDLILDLDDQNLSDHFMIKDGGQVIYDNSVASSNDQSDYVLSFIVDYPLKSWQIDYYLQNENNTIFYLLSMTMLIILAIFIILIFVYSHREYTRSARLAIQQVNFVGQVSHEFKTPLTNIILYSEMLKEHLIDEPDPIPEYIDIITQESQRLTRLIQNVLNFTKSTKINITSIHLNRLLDNNCQIFRPILAKKSINLNFTTDIDDDEINSDADKIIQIINNLLSNAEKYAAKGHQVDLSIRCQNNMIIISIRDYGDGIPSSSLAMIFQPFYRLNSSLTEGVSGTGIGLTIAKQLAIQLQGDIAVKNMHPGAEFSLILPKKYQE